MPHDSWTAVSYTRELPSRVPAALSAMEVSPSDNTLAGVFSLTTRTIIDSLGFMSSASRRTNLILNKTLVFCYEHTDTHCSNAFSATSTPRISWFMRMHLRN